MSSVERTTLKVKLSSHRSVPPLPPPFFFKWSRPASDRFLHIQWWSRLAGGRFQFLISVIFQLGTLPHLRYPSSEIFISLARCRTVPSKPSLTSMALSCCCSWSRSPRSSFHLLTSSEKYSKPTTSFSWTAQKPPPRVSFSTVTRTWLSPPTTTSGDIENWKFITHKIKLQRKKNQKLKPASCRTTSSLYARGQTT